MLQLFLNNFSWSRIFYETSPLPEGQDNFLNISGPDKISENNLSISGITGDNFPELTLDSGIFSNKQL